MLAAYRDWPSTGSLAGAPWWVWVGGLLGAFYVLGSVVAAPKLGAATLVAVILAGQAFASLLVDHFGWVGFEENPITPGPPARDRTRRGRRRARQVLLAARTRPTDHAIAPITISGKTRSASLTAARFPRMRPPNRTRRKTGSNGP